MTMLAPRSQRPPQPPLLPPPSLKIIPQPPPPPSSRPSLAAECPANAYSHPRADVAKIVMPLQSRVNKGSYSAHLLRTGFTGRGLIPLPPPSLSFKPNGSAPPPPPPDNPAKVNYEPSQRIFPQRPLLLPLEAPRISAAARSPAKQNPPEARSTVLVLPLPCCPHRSRTRLECQRDRVGPVVGDAADLQQCPFDKCRPSLDPKPEKGSNALSTKHTLQESECDASCQRIQSNLSETRNTPGESWHEILPEIRSVGRRTLAHPAEVASGGASNLSNHSFNMPTKDRTTQNDLAPLQFHRAENSDASQAVSPAWKGPPQRPCGTHVACKIPTKETSCTRALQLSPSDNVSCKRTTEAPHFESVHEHGQRRRAFVCSNSACNGGEGQAQPVRVPPMSSAENHSQCIAKQITYSSRRRDGESMHARASDTLSCSASTPWNILGEQMQSSSVRDTGFPDQRPYPQSAAHAVVPAESAHTSARSSDLLNVQWSDQCSVKPCHSVASSSSSGRILSIYGDREYGAGDGQGLFPACQPTPDLPSDMEETPSSGGRNRNGRTTGLFLSGSSTSNGWEIVNRQATHCAEETSRLSRFDSTTRRCSLRPAQTGSSGAAQRSTDAGHCVEHVVDTAAIHQGAVSGGYASSCSAVQTSIIQKGLSSFGLTTRTRVGLTKITVLPPPAETSEIDTREQKNWVSVPQLAMVGEPPSYRTGEIEVIIKRKHRPWKIRRSPSWHASCLQRTLAPPSTPQKLNSPGQPLRPSPCTATLSHLPPSPLTPLAPTNDSARKMSPSLLLAGKPQKSSDALYKREIYSLSGWTDDNKTGTDHVQAEREPPSCKRSTVSSPAPPSHAQSPRYGGHGVPRYRRRKQNKIRRRLKCKMRREEALGGRRQLYTHVVPSQTANEEARAVESSRKLNTLTHIKQKSSVLAITDEHSSKARSGPSRTTTESEFDSLTTEDPSSMPDCEAWASSPAVVARHIKSRRLTSTDSEWCTGVSHKAHSQQDCGTFSQPAADKCSCLDNGNLHASPGVRRQDYYMQAKCNRLFMPSNLASVAACRCEGDTSQRGVLYTFELPEWQRCELSSTCDLERESDMFTANAQQERVQALQDKQLRLQARLHAAVATRSKQISGQAAVSVPPLPSSLGLPSRGCSTSTGPPSPLYRLEEATHTARRTSVLGHPDQMRLLSHGSQRQDVGWCCRKSPGACSPRSKSLLGAGDNSFQGPRNTCDLENWRSHAAVQLHTDAYNGHMKTYRHGNEVRSRSASGCCSDSTYCDSTPSSRGASSNMLSEEVDSLSSFAFRDRQCSSKTDLTHHGEEENGPVNKTIFSRERKWGGAGDSRTYQDSISVKHSLNAVQDRGTTSIRFQRSANCHSVDRRFSNFSSTNTSDRHPAVVCQSEGTTAHRTGGL